MYYVRSQGMSVHSQCASQPRTAFKASWKHKHVGMGCPCSTWWWRVRGWTVGSLGLMGTRPKRHANVSLYQARLTFWGVKRGILRLFVRISRRRRFEQTMWGVLWLTLRDEESRTRSRPGLASCHCSDLFNVWRAISHKRYKFPP